MQVFFIDLKNALFEKSDRARIRKGTSNRIHPNAFKEFLKPLPLFHILSG